MGNVYFSEICASSLFTEIDMTFVKVCTVLRHIQVGSISGHRPLFGILK